MGLCVRLAAEETVGLWAQGVLVAGDDGMLLCSSKRGLLENSWRWNDSAWAGLWTCRNDEERLQR